MNQKEAKATLRENWNLFEDLTGTKVVHNIDSVERYYTMYALLNDELILYFAPTYDSCIRGNTEYIRIEWFDFLEKIKK